jgi:hypothetical protein
LEPFKIRTSISKKEYTMLVMKKSFRKPIILIAQLICIGFLVFYILIITNLVKFDKEPLMPLLFALYGIFYPLFMWRWASKNYDASNTMHIEWEYEFAEDHINHSSALTTSSMKWETITKAEEINGFLLLYMDAVLAMVINKDRFSEEQLQFIRQRLKRK